MEMRRKNDSLKARTASESPYVDRNYTVREIDLLKGCTASEGIASDYFQLVVECDVLKGCIVFKNVVGYFAYFRRNSSDARERASGEY